VAVLVATVLGLAGVVMLGQAARSDLAVKRWTHTRGIVGDATKAHLADDGRRWWDVRVSYRSSPGEEHDRWVRKLGDDVDRLLGEEVDVWFDARRPDRCHVALAGGAARSSWVQYGLGAVLVAGAAVVLTLAAA
jgi:hypothetical protein